MTRMALAYTVSNTAILLVEARTTVEETEARLRSHPQEEFRAWAKRAAFALERGRIGRVAVITDGNPSLHFYVEFDSVADAVQFALAYGAKPLSRAVQLG